jgi:imidazoleglycerol-phosphate dehydratase
MGRSAHRCKAQSVQAVRSAAMAETQTGVRLDLAPAGAAAVSTGLPVLDHLVKQLAETARFRLTLEVAPESTDEAVAAAGRALGRAVAEKLDAGLGWALVPADEALALCAVERVDEALLVTNVDFSGQRVGGIATDVASRFLEELVHAAGINMHVRLVEGIDPQHVLAAIFKAVGAALGQACRPVPQP